MSQERNQAMEENTKRKIILLQLNVGIWAHGLMELNFLRRFHPTEVDITIITCGGIQTAGCLVRHSKGKSLAASRTIQSIDCRNCRLASKVELDGLKTDGYQVEVLPLSSFSLPSDRSEAESFAQNYLETPSLFELGGVSVDIGKCATYEWSLHNKRREFNLARLSKGELAEFSHTLVNAHLMLNAFSRCITQVQETEAVFCFSPQYSINNSCLTWLEGAQPRIRQFLIEGSFFPSNQYRSLQVWDWRKFKLVPPAKYVVENLDSSPDEEKLEYAANYLNQLNQAKSFMVYSKSESGLSSDDILRNIKLSESDYVVTVALSSPDEVTAARMIDAFPESLFPGRVYPNQQAMVMDVIDWAHANPNVGVVLRPHPREFPEARNNKKSDSADFWLSLAECLPPNVYLNTPKDVWSIGDLISFSKKLITGWSSVALQAALMGVEVQTYDSEMGFFPRSMVTSSDSPEEFRANLNSFEAPTELNKRRKVATNWLWLYTRELEVETMGPIRLTNERIRTSSPLRKAMFLLDEFFPYMWRRIEDRLQSNGGRPVDRRLAKLLDSESGYLGS